VRQRRFYQSFIDHTFPIPIEVNTMRPIQSRQRGSRARAALLGTSAIVVAVVGTVATLVALGHMQLPFWRRTVDHTGMVRVPIRIRPIPAYTMITRDYLMDPKTGELAGAWYLPERVPKGVITDLTKILGRVTNRQKEAMYHFSENDFLPEGTRPGMAAGVPAGKRAMTIEASKLNGIYGLQPGDHFDLVASIPVDKLSSFGGADWNRLPASAQSVPHDDKPKQRLEARMLARNAVVVSPVTTRAKPVVSSSLTSGQQTHMVPIAEIVIAVAEDEVAPLADALGLTVAITCVAHSGRPEDKAVATLPEGMLSVPVNGRAMAAYSQVLPEDLLDPGTGQQKFITMNAAEVKQRRIVANPSALAGRVLARDKNRGQIFSEDDFLPSGTAPGLAGGIPPGKRAVTLDASKVGGARALRLGDHFDLVASTPIDWSKAGGQGGTLRFMGTALAGAAGLQKQAAVRAVVQDGVVVVPVASPTLTAVDVAAGGTKQAGEEMLVAVSPDEVPRVAEALALGLGLTTVVRSGNPQDASQKTLTPDENPLAQVKAIESIIGNKRETLVFQTAAAADPAKPETIIGSTAPRAAVPAAVGGAGSTN
jgi:Flp pilus assembly protein CpaB